MRRALAALTLLPLWPAAALGALEAQGPARPSAAAVFAPATARPDTREAALPSLAPPASAALPPSAAAGPAPSAARLDEAAPAPPGASPSARLPRLEQRPEELGRGLRADLGALFDGDSEKLHGHWKEPADARGARARQAADAALPPGLAARLERVSALPPAEGRALLKRLASTDIRVRGPPAFSSDHTFSLELEFLVSRQAQKLDVEPLFADDPMTTGELAELREEAFLSQPRYARAWELVAGRVARRMPKGWRLFSPEGTWGSINTLEINTSNRRGVYHVVSSRDWAELVAGLERVQHALPGGVYSVHVHNGLKSRTRDGELMFDPDRFGRLVKVYEAMWRALAGLGYRAPSEPKTGATGNIDYPDLEVIGGDVSRFLLEKRAVGFSDDFPTVETRIASGLLRQGPRGEDRLDPKRLAGDLWWTFALMRAAASDDDFSLVTLGLPVTAGLAPSAKQLLHFADRVYRDDVVGKALALQRLARRTAPGARVFDDDERAGARREIRGKFEELGLAEVHDMHARAGGIDERLVQKLERDPELFARVSGEVARAHKGAPVALELFPAQLRSRLEPVLARERYERSVARRVGRVLEAAATWPPWP